MRPVTELQRAAKPFEVISPYSPSGDQPTAIAELTERLRAGEKDIVLLGATGTGKTTLLAALLSLVPATCPPVWSACACLVPALHPPALHPPGSVPAPSHLPVDVAESPVLGSTHD